jgi:DNA-binding NtrC family response regulator
MHETYAGGTDLTVLVVDDEDDLREVIRRILERKGFSVLVAGDADEAVAVCRDYPGEIHVLLTDLSLPGIRGNELARQAVEVRPGLRVVYVSGTSRDLAVGQGLIEEDAAMLQKPFTSDTLAAAVRQAMAGSAA